MAMVITSKEQVDIIKRKYNISDDTILFFVDNLVKEVDYYKSFMKEMPDKKDPAIGLKHDSGKQKYHAMPLCVLGPLADTFTAGVKKYEKFNCLKPFSDSDSRFWDGTMRHLAQCQLDPLAKDAETGCYHAAQAAFNILLRLYHARLEAAPKVNNSRDDLEEDLLDALKNGLGE